MKIGILTLTAGTNYGGKLQNYALRTKLQEIVPSAEVVTINNDTCGGDTSFSRHKHNLKVFITNRKLYFNQKKKQRVFDIYNSDYLNYTTTVIDNSNIKNVKDIDCYVCGSDQVWNPNYVPNVEINTAYNAPKGVKRISYAASIGVENIPESRKNEYIKTIGTMDAVSVRENEAAKLIKQLLDKDVNVVLDPTLLLNDNQWAEFERAPKDCPSKYVLTYFLTKQSREIEEYVEKYARDRGMQLIKLNDLSQEKWFSISPNEFIYMIHHCDYFFTDSFHGTVFSLVFEKNFYTFSRRLINNTQKQGSRIRTLLGGVGLLDRFYEDGNLPIPEDACYENVKEKLAARRKDSEQYLRNALKDNSKSIDVPMEECVGCGACAAACPRQAIKMTEIDGFEYPIISNEICINCGICSKVCNVTKTEPFYNEDIFDKKAYCLENNNDDIRSRSSSGGVFCELAKAILEDDGVVYSPIFDENFDLHHCEIDKSNISLLDKAMGSKYIQSEAWRAYPEVKKALLANKKVLFTGTPCQITALKLYLGDEYSNLYTQDLICHGVSSKKYFKNYLSFLNERYASEVKEFYYRNKENGWDPFSIKVCFENGKTLTETIRKSKYFTLFLRNYILRPSCYSNCKSRKEDRRSDITLADFWGIKKHDNKGSSLVIVHSKKGEELLSSVKANMQRFEDVDFNTAIGLNGSYNTDVRMPLDKAKFDKEKTTDFDYLYSKYINVSVYKKIIRKINRLKR